MPMAPAHADLYSVRQISVFQTFNAGRTLCLWILNYTQLYVKSMTIDINYLDRLILTQRQRRDSQKNMTGGGGGKSES